MLSVLKALLGVATLLPIHVVGHGTLTAPSLRAHPYAPDRVCVVPSGTEDAGPHIIRAAHRCNHGGTVFFPPGDYLIATAVDLTFLDRVDFAIWGSISFTQDADHWKSRTFKYKFQDARLFWRFGGTHVNIYGNGRGVIEGDGPYWSAAMKEDSTVERPILFGTDGLHHATISETPAHNTDGWDTYRSSKIVIQDSVIINTDDCVSFKPNSTSVIVQNLDCSNSHGISVGSLGQYQGEVDLVEDLYIYNVTMTNAGNFARIKVWPGVPPDTTDSTSGGGLGMVRNVTYDHLYSNGNDEVITLTQCYFAVNQTVCDRYPASLEIKDVTFKNFEGTTSAKYDPKVGSLVCHDITATNINVNPPSGEKGTYECVNVGNSNLYINCV
ncbi:hypothetical protein BDV12DRAFT_209246 [Aspergillus spectabilis]